MDVRSDRHKGLSYTEIARKYSIDPRTAKKYAESETRPVYSLSSVKPSKLDAYKEQITGSAIFSRANTGEDPGLGL